MVDQIFSVSDFLSSVNQTLEYAYQGVSVEGEVSGFKVNQNKYVFFDLKDDQGSISCFMTVWQMRMPIEDGMKLIVRGVPKVTPWGKFSLTVKSYRPSGEGSLKKSFEILKSKLEKEGLFKLERKRTLPHTPHKIAVISSTQAAGYADFMEIIDQRWGGLDIEVAHVQVQGLSAPDQMIRAIRHFNSADDLAEVLVLLRGGGSLDDLAAFNDEALVREIGMSRIPVMVGVGHETDVTLADLVADKRASTPSNAAQLLVPDRRELIDSVFQLVRGMAGRVELSVDKDIESLRILLDTSLRLVDTKLNESINQAVADMSRLKAYSPMSVMRRGYAIVRGKISVGSIIDIDTKKQQITAEVRSVKTR